MKKTQQPSQGAELDEREQQIWEDHEWCLHDAKVQRKYGGQAVIAYQHKIWGVGKNYLEAWADAQLKPGCPAKEMVAKVLVPHFAPDTAVS
jgi:hypothetical protein